MYTIRTLSRYEHSWLKTEDFHNLFSQLTDSTLLSQERFMQWFADVQTNPCFTLFGVISQDKYVSLVGVGILWMQPRYYRNRGKSGHIEDVVIDIKHRGKGLGGKLVQYILDYAKDLGYYKIQLHCLTEYQAFYEKLRMVNRNKSMEIRF